MLHVNVRITGTQAEIAKFKKLGNKLMDFSSAFKDLGPELKTYYSQTVFGSEGGAIGKRWARLSPAYSKWKRGHYPNKGILIASGKMQKSFRATSTKNSLTIDNTDPKFIYHQEGTGFGGASLLAIGRGKTLLKLGGIGPGRGHNMPARPMLAVTPVMMDMVGEAIRKDVEKKLEELR